MRTACALALVAAGAAASAQPPPRVRLEYARRAGAERCPDEDEVRRAVVARLGYDPFVDAGEERTVRAELAPVGRALRARIDLIEGDEVLGSNQLTLKLRGCDELASAMELAIAIAVDPIRAAGAPEPPPAATPTTSGPPARGAPATAPPPTAPRPEPPPKQPRVFGHLGVLAAIGSAPSATWALDLGVGVQWRRWSLALELRGDIPASQNVAGGTLSTSLVLAELLPCVHVDMFVGCALVAAGTFIAWSSDFAVDRRIVRPFAGAGARAALEVPLPRRLAIRLHADLLGAITSEVLLVDRFEVFRTPPVSGAFGLALIGFFR
jgi:hypothetical protein